MNSRKKSPTRNSRRSDGSDNNDSSGSSGSSGSGDSSVPQKPKTAPLSASTSTRSQKSRKLLERLATTSPTVGNPPKNQRSIDAPLDPTLSTRSQGSAFKAPSSSLGEALERLYTTADSVLLSPDPLELVVRYPEPRDQEVAGLLASCWAYGRVETILNHVDEGLRRMGPNPADFASYVALRSENLRELRAFKGMVHRLHRGGDWAALVLFAGTCLVEFGGLKEAFSTSWAESGQDLRRTLSLWAQRYHGLKLIDRLKAARLGLRFGPQRHLMADAARGSASKRLNLWLRWMVRRDAIDPGPWHPSRQLSSKKRQPPKKAPRQRPTNELPLPRPKDLLLPLDTHTSRLCRYLGFTSRKTPNWSMAEEITQHLALFDPEDPVKYDFSLCRLGILELCPARGGGDNCGLCPIEPWCGRRQR